MTKETTLDAEIRHGAGKSSVKKVISAVRYLRLFTA